MTNNFEIMDKLEGTLKYFDQSKYSTKCRHCGTELKHVFCDLINSPPSNAMVKPELLNEPEEYFPLKIFVCHNCFLVQVDEMQKADKIFDSEYTYFSSYSKTMLEHSKKYVDLITERFGFNKNSFIIEVASNDGYLLQYFVQKGIPVLGIDPAENTAQAAKEKGVDTLVGFFGSEFAKKEIAEKNRRCDLILGNNVLAHVPDINDFVKGMKLAIKENGIVTMEFPHLERLAENCLFDSIYHEHFSYLSFTVVNRIFELQGLQMFDVEEVATHGGSLRIYAKNIEDKSKDISSRVTERLEHESHIGIKTLDFYKNFQERVDDIKYNTWQFLLNQKKESKIIAGYGAAAKANTLLNYSGIKGTDLIKFCVDASPHKQNRFLPGSHIPVVSEVEIKNIKPDYVIIFPWNLKKEITEQLSYIRNWGGKFITFVPELEII